LRSSRIERFVRRAKVKKDRESVARKREKRCLVYIIFILNRDESKSELVFLVLQKKRRRDERRTKERGRGRERERQRCKDERKKERPNRKRGSTGERGVLKKKMREGGGGERKDYSWKPEERGDRRRRRSQLDSTRLDERPTPPSRPSSPALRSVSEGFQSWLPTRTRKLLGWWLWGCWDRGGNRRGIELLLARRWVACRRGRWSCCLIEGKEREER